MQQLNELRKWNYQKHIYEDYYVPANWFCTTYCFDLETIINCPQCGRPLPCKDSYTSMEIHDEVGFGYCVCETCHEIELARRIRHEQEEKEKSDEKEE